ncbi:hypothetical protein GALMADRAFT_253103 [Galerina marginata CBS 339.88]|uniref:F-box domain-containing protein n=1 Tax=Galerina marginata (strain CBS 339.88) TaxID=685588 RepID=A0A067SZT1_GALM3|nr:hypothetical protein GALMADRAFT_253103 [Galerina marginata CBS 339.88]
MDQESEQETPALFTLRDSSQVCAAWRALAITAPTLWARVLNLIFLSERRNEWRDEVVRRTGAAALYIRGRDRFSGVWNIERFHSTLVDENWNRIRSLDIHFTEEMLLPAGESRRWSDTLQRPTLTLEEFRFSCSGHLNELSASDFVLFSNHAPSLRTLSADGIGLKLNTLSIPFIRHLVLHFPLSAVVFLKALREMPLLETLQIKAPACIIPDTEGQEFGSRVLVRKLSEIVFVGPLWTDRNLPFLTHVIPAPFCVTSFYSSDDNQGQCSTGPLCDALSICEGDSNAQLNSLLSGDRLPFFFFFPEHRRLYFAMDRFITSFPEYKVLTLLKSVNYLRLNKITDLTFRIRNAEAVLTENDNIKLVRALKSVQRLNTDCETLHAFWFIQSESKIVAFPALGRIRLERVANQAHVSFIRDFLNSRANLGMRIDKAALQLEAPIRFVKQALWTDLRALKVEVV